MNKIITIGREFGSGGRELGRRLAEELGFDYYDKEIVTEISNHTSLSEEYIRQVIERRPHHLFPITVGHSISYTDSYLMMQDQSIYNAQETIIKELAEKSDCVIMGRCADYILRKYNPYRIFVYADIDSRVKRCMQRETEDKSLDEKQMRKRVLRVDKERASYYNFYTDQKWGDKSNYDLCINVTNVVIKEVTPMIAKMIKKD